MTYVAIRTVSVACLKSVDLIQCLTRRLVYITSRVPQEPEVNPRRKRVYGNVAITCMHGLDKSSRVKCPWEELGDGNARGKRSAVMKHFVHECDKIGFPIK